MHRRTCPRKCRCPHHAHKPNCSESPAANVPLPEPATAAATATAVLCCTCISSEEELRLKRRSDTRRPAAHNVAALALQQHLEPSFHEIAEEGQARPVSPASDVAAAAAAKKSVVLTPWHPAVKSRRKATHDVASFAIREYLEPIAAPKEESQQAGCVAENCCQCEEEEAGAGPGAGSSECACAAAAEALPCCRCRRESVARRQARRRALQLQADEQEPQEPQSERELSARETNDSALSQAED